MEGPTFGFGEFETELVALATRFLDEQLPVTRIRELVASNPVAVYDDGEQPAWAENEWQRMVDMGLPALAVPERADGTPIATSGLVGLVEQCGRHAAPVPLGTTLSSALVMRRCGESADPWLRRIAAGDVAALATTDTVGSWQHGDCGVTATTDGDRVVVNGTAAFVQDAGKAALFVVQAATDSGTTLVMVEADAHGVSIENDHIHDLTRDQARVQFDAVAASTRLTDDAEEVLSESWPGVLALASADLCGVAEWLLQTTVEYASNREQFDRPIGFFQAVKHPLVNVMIEIDRARSLAYEAASLFDDGDPEATTMAHMAKSAASQAASFAADRAVQLHGGIGFTWENDVHIWFKRALHGQAIYGDAGFHRELLADRIIGAR